MVEKALLQSAVLMGSVKHTCANLTKFGYVKPKVESAVSNISTSAINKVLQCMLGTALARTILP